MIEYLKWDSEFFGFDTGKIIANTESRIDIQDNNYRLIYAFAKGRKKLNFSGSLEYTFLADIKITFHKQVSKAITKPVGLQIRELSEYDLDDNLLRLTYESGKFSRFKNDKYIPQKKFNELYMIWIKNSLNKSVADITFGYFDQTKIVGFITLKTSTKEATIGLFAVDEAYQGIGIGKSLIKQAEFWAFSQGINNLRVNTQIINKPARKFYKKYGFVVEKIQTIYHLWL